MFKHISFNNFKCLSGKTFELDKINIFTGYNGRGKSSVIQAILMLSQSVRKDDMNSLSRLHVNGDFVKLGDFDELLTDPDKYKFDISIRLSDTTEHLVTLGYEMTNDFSVGRLCHCNIDENNYFDTPSSKPSDMEETKKAQSDDLKQLPLFLYNHFWAQNLHYVSADRQGPVKFVERNEVPDFFNVGANGSKTINTISVYQEKVATTMNVDTDDKNTYNLSSSVTQWINEIMHGGSVKVDGTATRNKDQNKSPILKLGFDVQNKGTIYPSYNVGFGYSYILPIIVTALIAKTGDVVIIENPEAHLHPEAQTRLTFMLAKLAARGVQVFIETHSEHVINGIRLSALKDEYELKNDDVRIFFFDYDFRKTDLKIEPNGRILNWPERFFNQYQNELAEILKLGALQHGR